jgi:hypothetical protein
MGLCSDASQLWLTLLNGELCVLGLGMLGLGGYVFTHSETKANLVAVNEFAPLAPFVMGSLVLLVGLMGCLGAATKGRATLCVYWFMMLAVTGVVLAIGSLVLVGAGYLDNVAVAQTGSLVTSMHEKLNDFSLDVFVTCCEKKQYSVAPPVIACHHDAPVPPCIHDTDFTAKVRVPDTVCNAMALATIRGVPVGGPLPSGCASPTQFMNQFSSYVQHNIQPIGITLVVLSVALLMTQLMTCVLICSGKDQLEKLHAVYPG